MSSLPRISDAPPVEGRASGVPFAEALASQWLDYFRQPEARPPHASARDYLHEDLSAALRRLIPTDASVLEVGCGAGDLIASLPNTKKQGVDLLPEVVETARRRHPSVPFEVEDATAPPPASVVRWDAIICDRLCHSVFDVRALLGNLRRRLSDNGLIYLVTFNYLWELPARLAELARWKRPAPTSNWLSHSDFRNLFDIAGLEIVRYEDRLLLPLDLGPLSAVLNRYVARLPAVQSFSLYRTYVLRARDQPRKRTEPSVSVVVPTRNEAGNVAAAIARTPLMGRSTELIFVEGGSTDDTWSRIQQEMASYKGPLKLSAYKQTGKGKGDAVRVGFSHATGDILMILDGDLTVPPEDLPAFYDVTVRGKCDYVHGTRLVYPMEPGAMRFFNKIGNVGFSRLFTYLLQQPIKDTLCGTKVLWREDYERIAANRAYFGDFDPFGDFDLIFGAARLNLKILEIPVRYRDRTYGQTNISRWKHGVLLLRMSLIAARKLKFV